MQWIIEEKVKHRIIGVAVLLSIVIVLLPAMVKKSNQRLDQNMNLSLHLPPKPTFPIVSAVKPKVLFEAVKVATVVIPEVHETAPSKTLAHAESLSGNTMATRTQIQKVPVLASRARVSAPQKPVRVVAMAKPRPIIKKAVQPIQKKTNQFFVQVASFTQQKNALTLVQRLRLKGFKASFDKQGGQYRVLVGQLNEREQALNLKKQLMNTAQLSGFIVKIA